MTLDVILRLGRVSNLPTVWTNALAGVVLAGGGDLLTVLMAALALTFFYEGGMWLNDAFDADYDAQHKTDRPIARGEVSRRIVFVGGFAMLGVGVALSFALGAMAGLAGVALAVAILLYDWLHKRTVLSPVIMGATRFLSYALGATAIGSFGGLVLAGAAGLWAWVIGLTYAAKQETYDRLERIWPLAVLAVPLLLALWATGGDALALLLWGGLAAVVAVALRRLFRRAPGDVPKAVVTLIAGVSLFDATLIAGYGEPGLALLAASGFVATLGLQRVAAGT